MFCKEITYTDYKGNKRTEKFYFHMSQADILRLEMNNNGSISETVKNLIIEKDMQKLWNLFEHLVTMSYGIRSEDGRRFIKNDKLREEFMQTQAYSDFIVDMIQHVEKANEFVEGLMSEAKMESDQAEMLSKFDSMV